MSYLGSKVLDLIEEGLDLRSKIKNTKIEGYRNPLWYDEAKERLAKVEEELSELLEPSMSVNNFLFGNP